MERSGSSRGVLGLFPLRAVFKDPIHVLIPVNRLEYEVIEHPAFLRLHGIKQLGFTYLVYPQAKHTRFEHSLGSMHVAHLMAESILRTNPSIRDELLEEGGGELFVQLVRLSALLHDIGHLPYSHATEQSIEEAHRRGSLEGSLRELLSRSKRRLHELGGCSMAEKLLREVSARWEGEHGELVERLAEAALAALCASSGRGEKTRIFTEPAIELARSIISGHVIDADRMDYLVRDAYNTGATYGRVDVERLASGVSARIADGEVKIIYPAKLLSNIEELYYSRYMMYRWVYMHHKVLAMELTYSRLLQLAAEAWPEALDCVERLVPSPPRALWDLFHPETIWRYVVESNIRVDDGFVDVMLSSIAKCSGRRDVEEWASRLFRRRPPYVPLAKRQEVLMARLARKLSEARGLGPPEVSWVEYARDSLRALSELVPRRWESYESLAELLEREVNRELGERGRELKVVVKLYAPITSGELREPLIDAEGELIPLAQVSSMVRAVHEIGGAPTIFLFAYVESEAERRNFDRRTAGEYALGALARCLRRLLEEEVEDSTSRPTVAP